MKVLHVIPSVSLLRGGPSQAVLAMVKALRAHNIEAEIATTDDDGPGVLSVALKQRTEYKQVPVWFFHRFSPPLKFVREFAFSSSLTGWLWKHVCDFDLLHIHSIFSYPSTIAMRIARIKHVPYIIRPAGALERYCLKQKSFKKRIYLSIIEGSNINQSQAIHFTSDQEALESSRLGFKAPGIILPHGVSIPNFVPDARSKLRGLLKLTENEPVILFMSRLHPKKGLEYLIPALASLADMRFTFVIAGSGEPSYELKIEQLLKSYKISERTHRFGFITGEKKDLLLQGSDILVLTSNSENFAVAVFEAMAAGLPVLVSQGVAAANLIKKERCGYVVKLDIANITSAIKTFLHNIEHERAAGQRGKELVLKEFNWDSVAVKLIRAYENIISAKMSNAR
ncbi:MAG: glycosyltransferase [Candidatus Omnitrophica bacterium]|nr:glycosyltransferase [Candidatus Omnitrophota bacterium]MDD5652837.1 glycosyltransferase [Candidatus Omnitrophota bacterium]